VVSHFSAFPYFFACYWFDEGVCHFSKLCLVNFVGIKNTSVELREWVASVIYLSEVSRIFVLGFVIFVNCEYTIIVFVEWKFAFRNYMNGRAWLSLEYSKALRTLSRISLTALVVNGADGRVRNPCWYVMSVSWWPIKTKNMPKSTESNLSTIETILTNRAREFILVPAPEEYACLERAVVLPCIKYCVIFWWKPFCLIITSCRRVTSGCRWLFTLLPPHCIFQVVSVFSYSEVWRTLYHLERKISHSFRIRCQK